MSEPKIVTLTNGAEVPEMLVKTTLLAIRRLHQSEELIDLLATWDLLETAKTGKRQMHQDRLAELGLANPGGGMHEAIRDIVLSALSYDAETTEITLRNPVRL